MNSYFGDVWLVRLLLQRGLAALFLIAFISALNQFKALLGEQGLLPVPRFVDPSRRWDAPSIFNWHYSDRLLEVVAWIGILLSLAALSGLAEAGSFWLCAGTWLILWLLYLSIVNVGQTFYAFGWESMLLEAGFFAAFTGPAHSEANLIPVLILRWMLFRTEVGAGLIKLRHDQCWRDFTCLFYHYETQPLPNPLSWYFHRIPKILHRFAVLFSHFVQIIVPFGLFAPQPVSSIAGSLTIFHQLWLNVSGNYSWLNWLTVVLGFAAYSDATLKLVLPLTIPQVVPNASFVVGVLYGLAVAVVLLSIRPVLNLFSKHQLMNYSYNRFHLINTYGAFGSVTKKRYEIIIECTDEPAITPSTRWQEYEFKAKPGDPNRMPPQVAPYHLRLDWLMWFLPFSVLVGNKRIQVPGYEIWFLRLVQRLLQGDKPTIKLLKRSPLQDRRPTFVRALFYLYRYTTPQEKRASGAWWTRSLIDIYLPAVSLNQLRDI